MKLIKLLVFTVLLFLVFPVYSIAEPIDDAAAAVDAKDWDKAYELLTPLSAENNLLAKTLLGTMYINGQGVESDANKGLAMIMDAAKQGNEIAKGLAAIYNMELAKAGDVKAMYNIGYMCLSGWTAEGEMDNEKCLDWLVTAAQNGHKRSAKVLSQIYAKGKFGIAKDEMKAAYFSNLIQE
ncbi:tetratricopeptide repeat protein [Thermodesulfobacteriota bacterium]